MRKSSHRSPRSLFVIVSEVLSACSYPEHISIVMTKVRLSGQAINDTVSLLESCGMLEHIPTDRDYHRVYQSTPKGLLWLQKYQSLQSDLSPPTEISVIQN